MIKNINMKKLLIFLPILLIAFISCKKTSDKTAPVIILNGASSLTTGKGYPFNDPGATASDDTDGDITSKIIVDNPVDTGALGIYYVTYNVTDNAGNAAIEVKRKVEVRFN